jgi:hypothetical protein
VLRAGTHHQQADLGVPGQAGHRKSLCGLRDCRVEHDRHVAFANRRSTDRLVRLDDEIVVDLADRGEDD